MKSAIPSVPISALTLVALALPLFGFTCGNEDVPIGDDSGTPSDVVSHDASPGGGCRADSDCVSGQVCGYAIENACTATGICLPGPMGAECNSVRAACGCNGLTAGVPCWFPTGYSPSPILGFEPCSVGADAGTPPPDGGATGGPCAQDTDCGTGAICGYPISNACNATGVCLPAPTGTQCQSVVEACGCNGAIAGVPCWYPNGFAPQPIESLGICGQASDAGAPPPADGGIPANCTTNSDCATGSECGYPIAQACMAHGVCVTPPMPLGCGAVTQLRGCGCSGSEVDWIGGCSPQFPEGYAPAPVTGSAPPCM